MIRFFSLLLMCISLVPVFAVEWFTTNRAGIPDRRLESGPAGVGWSLSREELEGSVVILVYLDAELDRKIVTRNSDGYLISREEFNADGELVNHVEYAYDSDGKMRVILFNDKTGGTEPSKIFTSLDNNIDWSASRATEGIGEDWNIKDKNQNGRDVREVIINSETVSEEIIYTLDEEGNLLEKRVISGDMETRSEFDPEGFMRKETRILNELVISEKTYEWGNSRLLSVEEKTPGNLARLENKWDRDQIIEEIQWINGEKEQVTFWSSPTEWTETIYRNNRPVLRIYWKNNVRLKEEILNTGLGIRERE